MSERMALCCFMLSNTHLQAFSCFSNCLEAFAISESSQRSSIWTGTIVPKAPSSIGCICSPTSSAVYVGNTSLKISFLLFALNSTSSSPLHSTICSSLFRLWLHSYSRCCGERGQTYRSDLHQSKVNCLSPSTPGDISAVSPTPLNYIAST